MVAETTLVWEGGCLVGFALPSISAAGYSFSRPWLEGGGMEEAARSLRRLVDDTLQSLPRADGAVDGTRRPRIIAKIDGRAGDEPWPRWRKLGGG